MPANRIPASTGYPPGERSDAGATRSPPPKPAGQGAGYGRNRRAPAKTAAGLVARCRRMPQNACDSNPRRVVGNLVPVTRRMPQNACGSIAFRLSRQAGITPSANASNNMQPCTSPQPASNAYAPPSANRAAQPSDPITRKLYRPRIPKSTKRGRRSTGSTRCRSSPGSRWSRCEGSSRRHADTPSAPIRTCCRHR